MKTINFFAATLLILGLSGYADVKAQNASKNENGEHRAWRMERKAGAHEMNIPNLTEEQKTKIKSLRLATMKEIQPLRNQLGELRAKGKTLTTCEKSDMKAINANIDDITKLQNQIMKIREANHQQIRALLTDEQRIFFDMKKHDRRMGPMNFKKGARPEQVGE